MIFVNSVSWALYLVLIKPLMEKYNSITIMKWIILIWPDHNLSLHFYIIYRLNI